jgi:chromosome segregation ATPase
MVLGELEIIKVGDDMLDISDFCKDNPYLGDLDMQTAITMLLSKVQELEKDITDLEENVFSLREERRIDIANLESTLDSRIEDLEDSIHKDIESINEDISECASQDALDDIKDDIVDVREALSTIENEVSKLEDSIIDLTLLK